MSCRRRLESLGGTHGLAQNPLPKLRLQRIARGQIDRAAKLAAVCDQTRASFRRFPSSPRADACYRVKLIVTVTSTGTGTPFKRVGVYSHCRTASSAA